VLKLVEGQALGRVAVQRTTLVVAGHEHAEDWRVQAVVGGPQQVLDRIARSGRLEVEH